MAKRTMNQDIKDYPIYALTKCGQLVRIHWIKSTEDYDHRFFNLHHYIKRDKYYTNSEWYINRGIEQKLILLPISIHEQVEQIAIKNLSDEDFENRYKISRWNLLFNRRQTEYGEEKQSIVDMGFWDKNGDYKEDKQAIKERDM